MKKALQNLLSKISKGFNFSDDKSSLTQHLPVAVFLGGFVAIIWAYFRINPIIYAALFGLGIVGWEVYFKITENKPISRSDIFWGFVTILFYTILLLIFRG